MYLLHVRTRNFLVCILKVNNCLVLIISRFFNSTSFSAVILY